MALDGEELPPVVAVLQANIRDLIAGLQEAKAMLAAFQRDAKAEAEIGADTGPAMTKMAGLEDAIIAFNREHGEATLDVDAAPAMAKIGEVQAALTALSGEQVRTALRFSALPRGALNAMAAQAGISGAQNMRYKSDVISALLGAGATGALAGGGGGGKKGGGLLGALGWGGGALFGMAHLGSLLGLMGFGAEHAIATGVGVGGSAIGGLLGGGLLGLGSLGVMGTGMATDMAGIGQASNDIKLVVQAQNALNQAIAVYGKNSVQAAQAQAQLNYTLSSFSPVARGAVLAAANTAQQFETLFDKATGYAERAGAQIIQEAMVVGEKFLPSIGIFAYRNMQIIKGALQPLFAWLQDPQGGFGIFTQLETQFTSELPTAMHAFDQAFEFVIKTIGVAAGYTGGLIAKLDQFFTKMNGADFGKWVMDIGKLVSLFHTWWNFLKQVAITVYDIFKPAAGVGAALITILTQLLAQVDKWLTGTGKNTLGTLFGAHLGEITALGSVLKGVLPILLAAVNAFLKMEAAGANLAITVLRPFAQLLSLFGHAGGGMAGSLANITKQTLGWGLAIGLVASRLKPLMSMKAGGIGSALGKGAGFAAYGAMGGAMISQAAGLHGAASTALTGGLAGLGFLSQMPAMIKGAKAAIQGFLDSLTPAVEKFSAFIDIVGRAGKAIWGFAAGLAKAAIGGLASLGELAAGFMGLAVESQLLNAVLGATVIGGIILLGVAIYELVTHWKQVWGAIKAVALDVWGFLKSKWGWLLAFFLPPIGALVALIAHWRQVWGTIKTVAMDVWHFLDNTWHSIQRGVTTIWNAVVNFLASIPHRIIGFFANLPSEFFNLGKSLMMGLIHGIESTAGKVGGAIMHAIGGKGLSIGGVSLNPFHYLAAGGIVTRPTLAVVGEAGPEMVIPMNRLKGATISGGVSPLPTSMGRGGMGGQHLTVNVIGPTNSPQETAREVAWVARPFMAGLRAG